MEKRTQKSMRKIKSRVFLILLTLILAITATYAWFSTQRDIEVSGMRLNVEVAESLQISLDGEIWTQSIQIANMRQFYGTYTGTGDIASTLKTKLLSKFGTNTNTTYNGKATAYLMDTNKWSGFGNTYTDYAIGGPTLELFAASYNLTHETDIDTQVLDAGKGYGYKLKWSSASTYGNSVTMDYSTIENESLYFINNNERAYSYWVVSPSAGGSFNMFCVVCLVENERAYLSYNNYYDTDNGVRTVVVLKSSVQLEKQEDGTFKIIN